MKTIEDSKFEKKVYYSEDDDCWVVEVPELPGCQADGETREEALENAEVIIQEWLETKRAISGRLNGKN